MYIHYNFKSGEACIPLKPWKSVLVLTRELPQLSVLNRKLLLADYQLSVLTKTNALFFTSSLKRCHAPREGLADEKGSRLIIVSIRRL